MAALITSELGGGGAGGIVSFQLGLDGGAGDTLLNPDARGSGVGAMRKRFTIKPIGAEYKHPKFAGVNIASFFCFFFFFSFHSKWLALPRPHVHPHPRTHCSSFENRRKRRKHGPVELRFFY